MRPTVARSLVAGVLGTVAALLVATPALSAPAPPRVGWWTQTSVTSPAPASAPVGPDVPAGGMLVASGTSTDAPLAYGAITFELPPDATAGTLVLSVASGTTALPGSELELCALDRPDFVPAAGGPMASAPGYSCARQVLGTPSADGKSYVFNAEPFRTATVVAVAVLPAVIPTRVVLAPVTAAALNLRLPVGTAIGSPASPLPAIPSIVSGVPGLTPAQQLPVAGTGGPASPVTGPLIVADSGPTASSAVPVALRRSRGFDHQGALALGLVATLLLTWTAASSSAARQAVAQPRSPSGDAP